MTLTELGHMTIELSHLTIQLGQKHLKNFSLMQNVVFVPNYFFSEKNPQVIPQHARVGHLSLITAQSMTNTVGDQRFKMHFK